jgi:hypothetical protein
MLATEEHCSLFVNGGRKKFCNIGSGNPQHLDVPTQDEDCQLPPHQESLHSRPGTNAINFYLH